MLFGAVIFLFCLENGRNYSFPFFFFVVFVVFVLGSFIVIWVKCTLNFECAVKLFWQYFSSRKFQLRETIKSCLSVLFRTNIYASYLGSYNEKSQEDKKIRTRQLKLEFQALPHFNSVNWAITCSEVVLSGVACWFMDACWIQCSSQACSLPRRVLF